MKGFITSLLSILQASKAVNAACSSNLLVDNYSNYKNNLNSVGGYTSDDGTCPSLTATTGSLSFKPNANCYFYSNFAGNCLAASTQGYGGLTFSVKGVAGGSFTIELQTTAQCTAGAKYTSKFYTVTGITGNTQTITVPFSAFTGANIASVTAYVFSGFSSTTAAWTFGSVSVTCNAGSGTTLSTTTTSSTTSSTTTLRSTTSTTSSTTSSTTTSRSTTSTTSSSSTSTTSTSTTTSTTSSTSSSTSSSSTLSTVTTSSTTSAASGQCTNYLVDDYASQSRLTFLGYNSVFQASGDDGSSTSLVVANNRLTITPKNTNTYFYSQVPCMNIGTTYGGIGLYIKAAAGATFSLSLQTSPNCDGSNSGGVTLTNSQLGITFDGTEKFYTIPFSKFAGLDSVHFTSMVFGGMNKAISFGPLSLYCSGNPSAYPFPVTAAVVEPSSTIPATTGPTAYLVDAFAKTDVNALGNYHGGDDATLFKVANGKLTINTKGNSDPSYYSQLFSGCGDLTVAQNGYVHIAYTGSNAFSVALQQHNQQCNDNILPSPFTWDDVEAGRYSNSAGTDIYIPLVHFNIDRTKTIGFALKGFYTSATTVVTKIEIVKTVPSGFLVPSKLDTAPLIFACTRPNSFAFAIDDGVPELTQTAMAYIKAANIPITFFTVGLPLLDPQTNFSNVYNEMRSLGHQIALHSHTHPPMEGLPTLAAIDWELNEDIKAVKQVFNGLESKYFRPPFGTEGARMRQRIAATIPGAKIVMWSADVGDWKYPDSADQQVANFQADVNNGGTISVCHYIYASTVSAMPRFFQIAKATGKKLMRVDQCLEDPLAPPL